MQLPTKCPKCNHFGLTETVVYDDYYTYMCPGCGNTLHLHYAAVDAIHEQFEDQQTFNAQACGIVKKINQYPCYVDNSPEFKSWVRENCVHIQTIELNYETAEYYYLDEKYYILGLNSGELKQ